SHASRRAMCWRRSAPRTARPSCRTRRGTRIRTWPRRPGRRWTRSRTAAAKGTERTTPGNSSMLHSFILAAEATPPELWQERSWQVAVFGGLLTAALAVVQAFLSLWQRRADFRWKQAELARQMIDEMYDFEPSHTALLMIDQVSDK